MSRRDDTSCGRKAHQDYFWTFKCVYHPGVEMRFGKGYDYGTHNEGHYAITTNGLFEQIIPQLLLLQPKI